MKLFLQNKVVDPCIDNASSSMDCISLTLGESAVPYISVYLLIYNLNDVYGFLMAKREPDY